MSVTHTVASTPLGDLTLVADDGVLTGVYFPHHWHRPDTSGFGERDDRGFGPAREQLAEYFAGERTEFGLPLALEGSAWQLRVWAGLQGIGYGETISYGELARRIGAQPAASRAVGLANGRNPVSIIVPCHRVIGADGNMTGYGGGLPRKRFLLMHEQRVSGQTLA